jgi:hypothetical protein
MTSRSSPENVITQSPAKVNSANQKPVFFKKTGFLLPTARQESFVFGPEIW